MSFVSPLVGAASIANRGSHGRLPGARRGPRRRPRARAHAAPRAVFLPPDLPLNGEEEDEEVKARPTPTPGKNGKESNGGVLYKPRRDNIDRLLEDTTFNGPPSTWQERNERRSLSMLRGRTEWSMGADELNESLAPDHLARHRHVLAPDEAFGAIFAWHAVVANGRELELEAWRAVAAENGLAPPDLDDVVRAESMPPEAAVERVFYWTRDWSDIKRLVRDKCAALAALYGDAKLTPHPGLSSWLALLARYGVQCVLAAKQPRGRVEAAVRALGYTKYFTPGALVTDEDEFDTLEQMLLASAIKAERPPQKCVVFADRPAAIAAAHEVSAKAVALIGAHPAYEVKMADASIAAYDELVVYNVRRLFSEQGHEWLDPKTELEN